MVAVKFNATVSVDMCSAVHSLLIMLATESGIAALVNVA